MFGLPRERKHLAAAGTMERCAAQDALGNLRLSRFTASAGASNDCPAVINQRDRYKRFARFKRHEAHTFAAGGRHAHFFQGEYQESIGRRQAGNELLALRRFKGQFNRRQKRLAFA